MRGLNGESVDLIYLDPPFNSNKEYAAPIGSEAAGAAFKDTWTLDDVDRLWLLLLKDDNPTLFHVIEAARLANGKGTAAYLSMMAQRLREMHRLLKPTGSLYLHCDPTASHYLKMLMDVIFGRKRYRNEIIWHYSGWNARLDSNFNSRHDSILFYAKKKNTGFNSFALPWESETHYVEVRKQKVHADNDGRKFVLSDAGSGNRVKRFLVDAMAYGRPISNVWIIDKVNNSSKEYTGFKTQKPLALLDRIIQASSNQGDVVFDPFCGCATACVVAEKLGRQWIGVDLSAKASELVQKRLHDAINEFPLYHKGDVIHRTDQPQRTDLGKLPTPSIHKDLLYGKQSGQCGGCMVMFHKRNLTIDHIVPQSKGGTDHLGNLWLLCQACNSSKGTKSQAEFLKERVKRGESIAWLQ